MLADTDPAALQVVLIGEGNNIPQALLDAANNVVALGARPREQSNMSPEVASRGRPRRLSADGQHSVSRPRSLATGPIDNFPRRILLY